MNSWMNAEALKGVSTIAFGHQKRELEGTATTSTNQPIIKPITTMFTIFLEQQICCQLSNPS
jgi:hypothetical protein